MPEHLTRGRLGLALAMVHMLGTAVAAAPSIVARPASPPPPKPRPGPVVHVDPPVPPSKRAARRLRGKGKA